MSTDRPAKKPTPLDLARQALELAPNPRAVDGPPAYWTWYDGLRADALKALEKDA